MELFSLVAKLTLDAKEYEKALQDAENKASNFEIDEPELTLDTDPFDTEMGLAEDRNVKDKKTKLGLDSKEFTDGVADAETQGENFGGIMSGVFDGIKTALTVSGVVMAVKGLVNSIKEAVDMTAATADGIDKGARRLGISTKAYQDWDHALRQSGSGISDLSRGVKTFQKILTASEPGAVLADAQDAMDGIADDGAGISKDVAQAFAQLGLSSKIANREITTTEELMNATLLALADFKGTREQRGVLTRALFGNNADGLNALLDSGKEGVEQLLSEASDLGLVMSEDEINQAVAYGDAVANLNEEINAIKMAFVEDIIPVLTDAVKWLTDFLTKLNPRLQTSSVYAVFDNIDKKALAATVKVDQSTASAKKLIEDLQAMGDYWTLDEQGRMTWDALAEKALELFPQLSQYIDKDGKKISGNTQEIEKNIDAWARLEKQRILATAMDEKSEAVAKQMVTAMDKSAEAAIKEAEAYGKRETAIKNLNALLSEAGRKTISTDATDKELDDALLGLMDSLGEDDPLQLRAGLVFKEWGEAKTEAATLRDEANKLMTEAQEAQQHLKDYEAELSKQLGLTNSDVIKTEDSVEEYIKTLNRVPANVDTHFHAIYDDFRPHAIGSAYIPYDNYPALLHRGEEIVTATDARRGLSNDIDYTQLEDRIVSAILTGMANANVTAVITDREVARGSNRYNGKELDAGRYRP